MTKVIVGLGTCGIAAGAEDTYAAVERHLQASPNGYEIGRTGCVGMCYQEPLVEVRTDEGRRYIYGQVSADRVEKVLAAHHTGDLQPVADWLVWTDDGAGSQAGYFARQRRIVLRNCGEIDPESLDEYLKVNGYQALRGALEKKDPEAVIQTIT